MQTDLPVRLFRNSKGIKFFGLVHEHPELKLNQGVGHVINIPGVDIGHYGYTNENVRRKRFERNLELLVRDREENPDRLLGKFLWIRDLAQMCGYELEMNGGLITKDMSYRAKRGIELFEELLQDEKNLRMVIDAIPFYSHLTRLVKQGFEVNSIFMGQKVEGNFIKKHLDRLIVILYSENIKHCEVKKYA